MAIRSHDKPPLMASASQPSHQGHPAQGHPQVLQSCCYLSLVLICRALASILAPVSPMALPLMSRETRLVLLPRALSRTLVPSLRRDSATDSDWRGWKRNKEGDRWPGHVKVHVTLQTQPPFLSSSLWAGAGFGENK